MTTGTTASAALVGLALAFAAPPPGEDALGELDRRLKAYVELRTEQEKALPPLAPRETDAARIREHTRALAAAMKKARSDARQGNVFHEGVRSHLMSLVRAELRDDRAQKSAIKQGNPGQLFLYVNADYPEGGSWSTVPPGLLAKLPPLPDDLQYRFADRHLLLVDMRAHILVDFLPKAAPR